MSVEMNDATVKLGMVYQPLGVLAKETLSAIEDVCRVVMLYDGEIGEIYINDEMGINTDVYVVDPNFFSFFTLPLRIGDPANVFSSPDRVVISESAAARYFPQQNPVGQTVEYLGSYFTISGIMRDMPKNSSMRADFVFPFFGHFLDVDWNSNRYHTFLQLHRSARTNELIGPLETVMSNAVGMDIKEMGVSFSLESLRDMRFGADITHDQIDKGSKAFIRIYALTALIILIISCINFANLFVSTSFSRSKMIGIKKCVGAGKFLLMREFYTETAYYVLTSVIIGLSLSAFAMPLFNNFTQSSLTIDLTSPQLYGFLAVLFVGTVLLAGSFPALYITRFNVLETISGKFKGRQASLFQKSLIVTQFAASIALLIVVAFMQKQINYILSYDLGFDMRNVVYVEGSANFERNFTNFRSEFLIEPSIIDIARTQRRPFGGMELGRIELIPSENQQSTMMEVHRVSPNYFDLLDIKLIEGINPFRLGSTTNEAIINESAAQLLGLNQAIDQQLLLNRNTVITIKGVINNVHTKSLHEVVSPQIYMQLDDNRTMTSILFKISGNPQRALTFIEQKWREREAESPLVFHFLDDMYKELYKSEINAGRVFAFAMLITLLITVAGLFAMAYYATQRRVREIAIRKVHGASLKDLFLLLNKGFLLWVAVAFVIACPIAYYGLSKWLSDFAVKTPLSAWVFLLVGVVAMLITLLATGYQTWKAATENPVEALKKE